MSRIGKQPVAVPSGVTVEVKGSEVVIKGSKGFLTQKIPLGIEIKAEGGKVVVLRKADTRQARAFHGLTRALIANMVKGLTEGYKKVLEISGVGYRASLQGKTLNLSLGFSHPINYPVPNGIEVKVEKNKVIVSGIDKHLVGQTAATIRGFCPPEPYQGKGVKYQDEHVRRKAGKTVK
ncbi:MAG: 50S ribosomal protein L6 [Candidatus Auribacterota bacterium]|nr:50S ribosomal protein L6 [Candidatus Auribacterota bacterium]